MKKGVIVVLALALASLGTVPLFSQEAAPDVQETLKALSAEVRNALLKENFHSVSDRMLQMKELGVSYLPDLVGPTKADPGWNRCRRQQMNGVKAVDLIYAATFLKKQEAAEHAALLEELFEALDLRSLADFSGRTFGVIREAMKQPELVDVPAFLDKMTDAFVEEWPVFMSHPETAHYLLDFLYGFTVEFHHISRYFIDHDTAHNLRAALWTKGPTPAPQSWPKAALRVCEAYERHAGKLGIACDILEKLALIRQLAGLVKDQLSAGMKTKTLNPRGAEMSEKLAAARKAILKSRGE